MNTFDYSKLEILSLDCCQEIAKYFSNCVDYVTNSYESFCVRFKEISTLFRSAEETKLADSSPESLVEMLTKLKLDMLECESLMIYEYIGIFRMNFTSFKIQFSDQISAFYVLLNKLIPDLFATRFDKLFSLVSYLVHILTCECRTIEEYVKVVSTYESCLAESEGHSNDFLYLMSLKDIVESFHIAKTDTLVNQYSSITNIWQRYDQLMADFDNVRSSKDKIFTTDLRNKTMLLLESVDRSKRFILQDFINDPESDPDMVIGKLIDIKKDVDTIYNSLKVFDEYQTILKFTIFNIKSITDLMSDLNSIYFLWKSIKTVKELRLNFMGSNFLDSDCGIIIRQLRAAAVVMKQNKGFNRDAVEIWLSKELDYLFSITPVVGQLQSRTFKEVHIRKIHDTLSRSIFDEDDITVGELVDVVKVQDFADLINDVFEESLIQWNLNNKVSEINKLWDSKVFTFHHESGNKSFAYVENFSEIIALLDDSISNIKSCIDSDYSNLFLPQFVAISDRLSSWRGIVQDLKNIQNGFKVTKPIFINTRSARSISNAIRAFKILDDLWRHLIEILQTELLVRKVCCLHNIIDTVKNIKNALEQTEIHIEEYITSQYEKFPKLHLINRKEIRNIISISDVRVLFLRCSVLFTHVKDINFHTNDPLSVISIDCSPETIELRKNCSARIGFVEWFMAIEIAIADKLKFDIMKLASDPKFLLEDLRSPKCTEQTRICALQILFWKDLQSKLKNHINRPNLKEFVNNINEQIASFNSLMSTYHVPFFRLSISNLILLAICHRELVLFVNDDMLGNESESSFAINSTIKKSISSEKTIQIHHGQFKYDYGFHYNGVCNRLILNPLTDKCFLNIITTFQMNRIPSVNGFASSGKKSMISALIYEIGADSYSMDCSAHLECSEISSCLKAVLGSGLWLNFYNVEKLGVYMSSFLYTILSSIQNSLRKKSDSLYLDGTTISINYKIAHPLKVCLFKNNPIFVEVDVPESIKYQFRPIQVTNPSRLFLFSVLLESYNFQSYRKIALKLDSVCDYVITQNLMDEALVKRLFIDSVRLISQNSVFIGSNGLDQFTSLVKLVFSKYPTYCQHLVTETDLKFICKFASHINCYVYIVLCR